MTARLPQWIEYGAFGLALLAGTVNAISVLQFDLQASSHVSGLATSLGISASAGLARTAHIAALLLSFIGGATISGLVNFNSSMRLGRQYGLLQLIEGLLLLAAWSLLTAGFGMGQYFMICACGLQNAMVSTYSGSVVRTTHLTGIFTDLGLMLGGSIRGFPVDRRKVLIFLTIITGFISGGAAGALIYNRWQIDALLGPVVVCLALAVLYKFFAWRVRKRF